jgi:hypothetical protein
MHILPAARSTERLGRRGAPARHAAMYVHSAARPPERTWAARGSFETCCNTYLACCTVTDRLGGVELLRGMLQSMSILLHGRQNEHGRRGAPSRHAAMHILPAARSTEATRYLSVPRCSPRTWKTSMAMSFPKLSLNFTCCRPVEEPEPRAPSLKVLSNFALSSSSAIYDVKGRPPVCVEEPSVISAAIFGPSSLNLKSDVNSKDTSQTKSSKLIVAARSSCKTLFRPYWYPVQYAMTEAHDPRQKTSHPSMEDGAVCGCHEDGRVQYHHHVQHAEHL